MKWLKQPPDWTRLENFDIFFCVSFNRYFAFTSYVPNKKVFSILLNCEATHLQSLLCLISSLNESNLHENTVNFQNIGLLICRKQIKMSENGKN